MNRTGIQQLSMFAPPARMRRPGSRGRRTRHRFGAFATATATVAVLQNAFNGGPDPDQTHPAWALLVNADGSGPGALQ